MSANMQRVEAKIRAEEADKTPRYGYFAPTWKEDSRSLAAIADALEKIATIAIRNSVEGSPM